MLTYINYVDFVGIVKFVRRQMYFFNVLMMIALCIKPYLWLLTHPVLYNSLCLDIECIV